MRCVRVITIFMCSITFLHAEILYRSPRQMGVARVVASDQQSVTIEFNLPALEENQIHIPEFGTGSSFNVPGIVDYQFTAGTPHVPIIRKKVLVPHTGNVVLEVLHESTQVLGKYSVVPYQNLPTHNGEVLPFEINRTIYATSRYYPAGAAEITSVEILRDIRIARVCFNPVRINPVSGDVVMVRNATIKLTFTNEKGENELNRVYKGITRSYIPFYKDVLNIDQKLVRGTDQDTVGCYVFLGSSETLKAVENLINWKKKKGYDVNVAVVDSVGSTGTAIDAWIEKVYKEWANPPEYLFIIGSEKVVAPLMSGGYEADNKFGVIGTGNYPSIHVGRISAKDENAANLTYQAWKILKHETEPLIEGTWLTKGETWGCSNPDGSPTANKWKDILTKGGLTVSVELEASGGAKGAELIAHFNSGLCTFGYKGHGSSSSMSSAGISVSTLQSNINNGRMLTWINNIGCNCSNFSGKYCIAEAWMCEGSEQNPKGCLGMFSFTVSSSVGGSDNMLSGIYEALMGSDPELLHIGAACDYGKTKGGTTSDINGGMLWGCPEIEVYTVSTPPALQASHATPEKGAFTITVTNGTSPVKGALVGVVKKENYGRLGAGYTDEYGKLKLTLPDFSGIVYITATAHNCKPYLYEGQTGISDKCVLSHYSFGEACPNPFKHTTAVQYTLPQPGTVECAVYSVNGYCVYGRKYTMVSVGTHSLRWHGTDRYGNQLPNGLYIMHITTDFGTKSMTVSIMK